MTPFECYSSWLSVKKHFADWKYDYFKYNGKLKNVKPETFEARRDKWTFEKMARHQEPLGLMIAHAIDGTNWAGDVVRDEKGLYDQRRKRLESLSYVFKNELSELNEDFNSNFKFDGNAWPPILSYYVGGRISPETLSVLSELTGVWKQWKGSDVSLVASTALVAKKNLSFFAFDKEKFSKIVFDTFKPTR